MFPFKEDVHSFSSDVGLQYSFTAFYTLWNSCSLSQSCMWINQWSWSDGLRSLVPLLFPIPSQLSSPLLLQQEHQKHLLQKSSSSLQKLCMLPHFSFLFKHLSCFQVLKTFCSLSYPKPDTQTLYRPGKTKQPKNRRRDRCVRWR